MKEEKIYIVSLPRTGTKTVCKMLSILGYDVQHAPGPYFDDFRKGKDALADTPLFAPSIIQKLKESDPNARFIYIDRPEDRWAASFENSGLPQNYNEMLTQPPEQLSVYNKVDLGALAEVFDWHPYDRTVGILGFQKHREFVGKTLSQSNILVYRFTDGWDSLCSFLNKSIPTDPVPHLNKSGEMFDKM